MGGFFVVGHELEGGLVSGAYCGGGEEDEDEDGDDGEQQLLEVEVEALGLDEQPVDVHWLHEWLHDHLEPAQPSLLFLHV